MSRSLRALMMVLLLASCGSSGGDKGPAPRDLSDACAILTERPQFKRAFRAAERRWGVPMHVQMATIYQESKFIADARTPFKWTLGVIPTGRQSSAFGYSQALDATWEEYKTDTNRFTARRDDIHDAADFMGWYMAASNESLGISLGDARNQYLAYHEGRTGYKRGTYNSKAWLLRVSGEVATRAGTYSNQLARCGGRRAGGLF